MFTFCILFVELDFKLKSVRAYYKFFSKSLLSKVKGSFYVENSGLNYQVI